MKAGELLPALKVAEKGIVTKKPRTEMFSYFCFEGDHVVTINDYVSIKQRLPGVVPEVVQVVPGDNVIDFISLLDPDDEVEFREHEDRIKILTSGGSSLTVSNYSRENFVYDSFEHELDFMLPEEFFDAFKSVSYSVSPKPTYDGETGVAVTPSFVVAASDRVITLKEMKGCPVEEALFIPVHGYNVLLEVGKHFRSSIGVANVFENQDRFYFSVDSGRTQILALSPHNAKQRENIIEKVAGICISNYERRLFDATPLPKSLNKVLDKVSVSKVKKASWEFNESGVDLIISTSSDRICHHIELPDVGCEGRVFDIPVNHLKKLVKKSDCFTFSRQSMILNKNDVYYYLGV